MPPSRVQLWVSQRDVWSGRFLLFLLELIWTKLVLTRRTTITITWSFTWRGSSDSKSRKVKWNFTKKENSEELREKLWKRKIRNWSVWNVWGFTEICISVLLLFVLNTSSRNVLFKLWCDRIHDVCHLTKNLPCFFLFFVLVSDCDIFTCSSSLWPHEDNKHSFSLLMSVFLSV